MAFGFPFRTLTADGENRLGKVTGQKSGKQEVNRLSGEGALEFVVKLRQETGHREQFFV